MITRNYFFKSEANINFLLLWYKKLYTQFFKNRKKDHIEVKPAFHIL